jgi:ribonuclease III
MESLENRINYKFSNPILLAQALTHPSLAYETNGPHFDNQRLEFLGDAVLQLALTHTLFERYPSVDEGLLTKYRSQLVSRPALQKYAQTLDLGSYLLMGKGEASSGGRERPSALADAIEALIGAIYLDSGFSSARKFVLFLCEDEWERLNTIGVDINPKGVLQEILQAVNNTSPNYHIIDQGGPDHAKNYTSQVTWQGTILGTGIGHSKKTAETAAAREALLHPDVMRLSQKK